MLESSSPPGPWPRRSAGLLSAAACWSWRRARAPCACPRPWSSPPTSARTALRLFTEAVEEVAGSFPAPEPEAPRTRRWSVAEDKVASMRDAVVPLVRDGYTLAIEGFTHLTASPPGTR